MTEKDKDRFIKCMVVLHGGPTYSPCSCAGVPSCSNTGCGAWWRIVLEDEDILGKVEKFYLDNKNSLETGVKVFNDKKLERYLNS